MTPGDEPYQLIRQWIETGALPASAEAPRVVKLHVFPRERLLSRDDQQQLAVSRGIQRRFAAGCDAADTIRQQSGPGCGSG